MTLTRSLARRRVTAAALALAALAPAAAQSGAPRSAAGSLPALPDAHGFAGGFAGVSGDALLFAGGANFPAAPPWEGGEKAWHDRVFGLAPGASAWREVGRLPRPLAYGASVTLADGPLCIGGGDAARHHADTFQLVVRGEALEVRPFPPLPVPLAYHAAARVDDLVYVVGGAAAPDATEASAALWRLDLAEIDTGWVRLADLPAPGRILPVAAALDGRLVVLSGAALAAGGDGRPARTYLVDAWAFDTSAGWRTLAPLPRAAVGAPSPAPVDATGTLWVLGGDDGAHVGFEPRALHPGFTRDLLAFDAARDTWRPFADPAPTRPAAVTAPTASWAGAWYVLSGELRPGVRTPAVARFAPPARGGSAVTPLATLDWLVIALYLGGMVAVGWWFLRRDAASTTEAYFRGGQRIPAVIAGLSLFATSLSSITFMGIPARSYATDCAWYVGQLVLLAVAPLVAFVYLPRFRRLDVTTAYELLERRFGLPCRLFGSCSFMLFHVGRTAIVLYLPALALSAVAPIPVDGAVVVLGVLCLVYTAMGGITAVAWTDAVQAVVLLGGALACFGLAVQGLDGGLAELAQVARDERKVLQNLSLTSLSLGKDTQSLWVLLIAFFFNVLVPYSSSQDLVQRYVTTRDERAARRSLWITAAMSIAGSAVFFALGVALFAFYRAEPERLVGAPAAGDAILPFFIVRELPTGVAGLVIAGLFAAAQSTVSSSLNSIATCWVKDVDPRLVRRVRLDREALKLAQVVVVLVGATAVAAALWMAHSGVKGAFELFNTYIGLAAGSLGGLFALAVLTERVGGSAALLGAVTGFVGVLALHIAEAPFTGLLNAALGFSLCFVVGVGASALRPSPR